MSRFVLRMMGALLLCLVGAACASTPKEQNEATSAKPDAGAPAGVRGAVKKDAQPRLTFEHEADYLGDVVRLIAQKAGGSIVLMKGLELRLTKPMKFRNATHATVVEALAKDTHCAIQVCAAYRFLYPADIAVYDALKDISLAGKLDAAYAGKTGAMTFGYGTPLYSAFALLSHVLGVTVVADNAVAQAHCGEVALGEIPLEAGLEALLKSARVVQFNVDSTDEYIFLSSTDNPNPRDALLNPEVLDDQKTAVLEKRVTVYLPQRQANPRQFQMPPGASKLREVLPGLSAQLGITVVAEPDAEEFPVNPAVFSKVRLRTALNLLIRQWLTTDYGYQVSRDRIVIRRK